MDENKMNPQRPQNPRRRKRSKLQTFKEAYLPVLIAAIALILILVIIVGAIVRAFQNRQIETEDALYSSAAASEEQARLEEEAANVLIQAADAAKHHDYDAAISVLDSFSGSWSQFPQIADRHDQYKLAKESMVLWPEEKEILNLSFQILIADAQRAFNNTSGYADSYKNHYVTTEEFQKILEQLYNNDYILVSTNDCYQREEGLGGTVITAKPLYLPEGKKPLILTQTNVCYNLYIVDSDGDKTPDKDGAGFANKLIIDENNNLAASIISTDGVEETGPFDLVPILEAFIETHPDFSYKGARAILALTGFDGILGYRTDSDATEYLTPAEYDQEIVEATRVYNALKECGYEFACYTYRNIAYGDSTLDDIKTDIENWNNEVVPIIGKTDIFVFAQTSDIAENADPYENEKYTYLHNEGFVLFSGFCQDGIPWHTINAEYIRNGRILVTAANLQNYPQWFEGILDPTYVITAQRN